MSISPTDGAGVAGIGDLRLGDFRLARYRLTLESVRGLSLPPFKGSTLRGGFGTAFKRIVCSQRESKTCTGCLLHSTCPYGYIFETPPPPEAQKLRNYQDVPRPFVFEPPADSRTEFAAGERLEFGLVLVGRAIALFPYFIVAFRELGEAGLGRGRRPVRLLHVSSDPSPGPGEGSVEGPGEGPGGARQVYDGETNTVSGTDVTLTGEEIIAGVDRRLAGGLAGAGSLRVRFETMTRLTFDGHLQRRPEFHVLIRNLLRRLSSLAYFHHGFELRLDFPGLIERAAQVRLVQDGTTWVDWERYSSRQDERMKLGGIVGEAVYEAPAGVLAEFLPLLALAEFTHVGKNATFGLGKVAPGLFQDI